MTTPATKPTHKGREYNISASQPKQECYPSNDRYQWQEFAGLAIEFGGYADVTAIDPYSGRRFWLAQAFACDEHAAELNDAEPGDQAMQVYAAKRGCEKCRTSTALDAIRRLLDAIEADGTFMSDPDARDRQVIPSS